MGFHASDTDKPSWSDKDMLLGRVKELEAQLENERAAHFTCVEMRNEAEAERDRLRARMVHYADWIDGLYMSLPTDRPPGPPRQLLKEMRADIDGQLTENGNK